MKSSGGGGGELLSSSNPMFLYSLAKVWLAFMQMIGKKNIPLLRCDLYLQQNCNHLDFILDVVLLQMNSHSPQSLLMYDSNFPCERTATSTNKLLERWQFWMLLCCTILSIDHFIA